MINIVVGFILLWFLPATVVYFLTALIRRLAPSWFKDYTAYGKQGSLDVGFVALIIIVWPVGLLASISILLGMLWKRISSVND